MSGEPPRIQPALADLRRSYERGALDEADAAPEPFEQFRRWFDDAFAAGILEPYAMTLATAGTDAHPSARIVLLRGWDERGFAFFTDCTSRKGRELAAVPFAALLFAWPELERQVRIEGAVELLSSEETGAYFARRPRGHRLAAWASRQSRPVRDRAALDAAMAEVDRRFVGTGVPRPPSWGGYRVVPTSVEFWQGRPNRLHDRLVYRSDGAAWLRERLAP